MEQNVLLRHADNSRRELDELMIRVYRTRSTGSNVAIGA
jgi:hypothetical protein